MTVTPLQPTTLSSRLRAETKDAHVRAERSGIMRRVLRGEIDREAYVALLVNLAAVYEALETELDRHADHPVLVPFALGALRRHATLLADVAALAERAPAPPGETARAYATHLRSLGTSAPALLVAHAYVRYLGDLSGGQILRGIVSRALALDSGADGVTAGTTAGTTDGVTAGTAFYDFTDVGDPAALKGRFRDAIDALPPEAADAMVREALLGFAMHEQLFTELDAPR